MSLLQILNIVRARYAVIVVAFVATTLVALGVSLLLPKRYSATAAVVVDVKSLDPVAGTALPGMLSPGYMSTQLDIINSSRVAARVVKTLKLESDPELVQKWKDDEKGQGDFTEWESEQLLKRLDAKPSRDSNVVQIVFLGNDPTFAANVANAFAQAFVDVDLDLKVDPARRYATWFDEQSKQARTKLENAQKNLNDFQQRTGVIVVSDEKFDAEGLRFNELTHQLTNLQSEISDSASKRDAGNPEDTRDAIGNHNVAELKLQIAQLEGKFQDDSGNLGANHPQLKREQAQLVSLRAQLARELAHVSSSFDVAYRVGKEREAELLDKISQQRTKVLGLNKGRDEYMVLQRDVQAAQREYDLISQRLAQMRLEGSSSQTNISILDEASVPLSPSKPKVLLNTLAGAFAGLVLGFACALLLEMNNRRIRSVSDLALAVNVPVLATIASVRLNDHRGRRRMRLLPGASPAT